MKKIQMRNAECGMRNQNTVSSVAKTLRTSHSALRTRRAFTLIELLVVISIIGVLAAFTIPVLGKVKDGQYKKVARGELELIATALENYKAKYGVYPPGNGFANALLPQLYYELAGTTNNGTSFVTLDGSATIAIGDVQKAYGVGGFVNCTKDSGEDAAAAKNFLSGLSAKQLNYYVTNNTVQTTMLITSVGGPDDSYKPLNASGLNPFRYRYPGVNNPNGYDLWVQLVIKGQTNLICNWSRQVIINSSLP